jgi:hypothetical protein
MIAVVSDWHPDLPFCALIVVLMILSFLPEWRQSVRKFHEGRELARQITAEHAARKALEKRGQ